MNRTTHINPTTRLSRGHRSTNFPQLKFIQIDACVKPALLNKFANKFNNERLTALLSVCSKFDIVSITGLHCAPKNKVKDFIHQMKKNGFKYIVGLPVGSLTSIEIVDGGVILFSKPPILDDDSIIFTLSADQDVFISKGAVYAKIQTTASSFIHVVATCLQSRNEKNIEESQAIRMDQLRQIINLLSNKIKDENPIFIMGNLNIDGKDESMVRRMKHTEYERLQNSLKFRDYQFIDMVYHTHTEHIETYGPYGNEDFSKNKLKKEMTLDYIIALSKPDANYGIVSHHTDVVPLRSEDRRFEYLSPHASIQSKINFAEQPN